MPEFQIPIERVERRAKYFRDRLSALSHQTDFSRYLRYQIDDDLALATAELYWLVNYAYKRKRNISHHHWTEHSKVAAFTAVSICSNQLLRRADHHELPEPTDFLANPMFAVRCACDRIKTPLNQLGFEETDRIYQGFLDLTFSFGDRYFELLKAGHQLGSKIELALTASDMRLLEDKITIFHLLARCYGRP